MAEQKRDYYEVLGMSKGASEEELKKALSRIKASEELEAAEKEEEEKAAAVTAAFEAAKNAGFIPSASQIPPSQKGGHSSRKGKGKNT